MFFPLSRFISSSDASNVEFSVAFTLCSDAYVALNRITTCLLSDELAEDMNIDRSAPAAIRAYGDFVWEVSPSAAGIMGGKGGGGRGGRDYAAEKAKKKAKAEEKKAKKAAKKKGGETAMDAEMEKVKETEANGDKVFELQGIDIEIPRGSLTAIVGRLACAELLLTQEPSLTLTMLPHSVGSGKSSLLQALIGEMRKVQGRVVFGGSTSYGMSIFFLVVSEKS